MGPSAGPLSVNTVLVGDASNFEALLVQLMSASNEDRGRAEALFNECKQHPDPLVTRLVQTLHSSQLPVAREMSAILLRKVITKDEISVWPMLSAATQEGVKAQLLQCVAVEQDKRISKRLCDTISELAAVIMDDGRWPDLLPCIFQWVHADGERLKECALLVFAQLAQYIGNKLQPAVQGQLPALHDIFLACLRSASGDVRSAALRATASFIQMLDSPADYNQFQDLLPGMLETMNLAFQAQDEVAAQHALEDLIELAGEKPNFLRRQLQEVVGAMLMIAEAEELEEGTRHLAIEFMMTLTEAREQAGGMMRRLSPFTPRMLAILLKMLLDIEDVREWHDADALDGDTEAGESSNYTMAQESLDRLAMALGGNAVLPAAAEIMKVYVQDSDWRKRNAALTAVAQIAEGCDKAMLKNLDSIVTMVLAGFQDPHARVRWAAVNAIGQLSTDLGPELQEQHHERVVPALIATMDDAANPRVQAHASAAILNFCENCDEQILIPYLEKMVHKLLGLLVQPGRRRIVQEGSLTALASVAECAKGLFEPYYDVVMPYLKAILFQATSKEDQLLRAKCTECISLVAMSAGKEKFSADATEVMQELLKIQVAPKADDDPMASYIQQAWARLCKCLGKDFLPYMQVVMPPLLTSAQLKPDVTVTEAGSDDEDDSDEEGVEHIRIGDKQITIRTDTLEEKATACEMLVLYLVELQEGFYPWVNEVASIMVPLLKFYFHDKVRKAAVSALPELLLAGKVAVEKGLAQVPDAGVYIKGLVDGLVPPLLESLEKEPDTELSAAMIASLTECVQVAGDVFEEELAVGILKQLRVKMEQSYSRKEKRALRRRSEDFDEEEEEKLQMDNKAEDTVFDMAAECVGAFFKCHGEKLMPLFNNSGLLESFLRLTVGKRQIEERRIGLCALIDIIEYGGEASKSLYPQLVPLMLDGCVDNNPVVRRAAAYGLGMCGEHGGEAFRPAVGAALERLKVVISQPQSRREANNAATENALAAVARICEHQRGSMDRAVWLPALLQCLPLREDKEEAHWVHSHLCELVSRGDSDILGVNNQNLPAVVSVFADVLAAGDKLASEETTSRMIALIRQMQQQLPQETLGATWASLTPQQQTTLQTLLSAPAAELR